MSFLIISIIASFYFLGVVLGGIVSLGLVVLYLSYVILCVGSFAPASAPVEPPASLAVQVVWILIILCVVVGVMS